MKQSLYDQDFYAWIESTILSLKNRQVNQLDIDNLTEELEGMGRSEKREILNRLCILIAHLLKWQYQSDKRSKSWELTIKGQRKKILRLLLDSPSLRNFAERELLQAHEDGILIAAEETGMSEKQFPPSPLTLDKYLDIDYLP